LYHKCAEPSATLISQDIGDQEPSEDQDTTTADTLPFRRREPAGSAWPVRPMTIELSLRRSVPPVNVRPACRLDGRLALTEMDVSHVGAYAAGHHW